MAFPTKDSYRTHKGPQGSPDDWAAKAEALIQQLAPVSDLTASLGVFGFASKPSMQELKKAYRTQVLKAHPDHGGTSEAFQEIQVAYATVLQAII